MNKSAIGIMALLIVAGFASVYGQDKGTVDVTLDVRLNVAEYEILKWEHEEIRNPRDQFLDRSYLQLGPLDGNWFTRDSVIRFSYTRDNFGGSMVLRPADFGVPPWMAWFNIGPMFRITAGSDIESVYADPQGADPGLRVYTGGLGSNGWNGFLNPDNITQDRGLLLEGFIGPVTAAITGMALATEGNSAVVTDGTQFIASENRRLQAGARLGSEIGKWGSVNASYFVLYERQGSNHHIINGELVPSSSISQMYNHHFGVFASLAPLDDLGITLGYGGLITKYLDEFWDRALNLKMETIQPTIIKNALMLNARYVNVIPNLTLRTDHNFTFWMDKDMKSLATNIPQWIDVGPEAVSRYPNSPDVSHFLLWNGIGVAYKLNSTLGLEMYVRNLHREDRSSGDSGEEFVLTRNEFFIEPKVVINFGAGEGETGATVRLEFGLAITNTSTASSADLNFAGRNLFALQDGSHSRRLATNDSRLNLQVPIGVTMQF